MNSASRSPRLWQLFLLMREAGISLTLEQLDDLQRAQQQGYDFENIATLQRISRLLWVKPSQSYSEERFHRAFNRYLQQYHSEPQSKPQSEQPPTPQQSSPPSTPDSPSSPLSTPKSPQEPPPDSPQIPIGVQTPRPSALVRQEYQLFPTQFPLTPQEFQKRWKSLCRAVPQGTTKELDLDRTLRRFQQEGIYSDVVLSPRKIARSELLLLIDDNNTMIPFMPMLRPLIESLEQYRLTLTYIYSFTNYPDQYLYQWQNPLVAETITTLLPKFHHNRTIALILSDAGAASRSYHAEQVEKIADFLSQLRPNIRQWLWLNPLPESRWQGTSAQVIANLPGGKMLELDSFCRVKIN